MKKKILLAVLLGLVCAYSTVAIRSTYWTSTGNVCGPKGNDLCMESLPQAGWPLPWWKDDSGTSVIGVLGPEDLPSPVAFLADALFFGFGIFLILQMPYFIERARKKPGDA